MKQITKPKWGVKPPLFDRIKERDDGGNYHELLDENGLRESLQQELSIMMDSRVSVRKVRYEDHIFSIPVYGAPDFMGLVDFSYFDAQNNSQWKDIQKYLKTAIEAIEPRLTRVVVRILQYDPEYQELYVEVHGQTNLGSSTQDVVFPMALNSSRQSRRA